MIKKLLLIFSIAAVFVIPVFALRPVGAVDVLEGPCSNANAQGKPELCGDNQSGASEANNPIFGPNGILTVAIRVLALITGVVSVIIIVVEGFRTVLAGSDANTAEQARRGIVWACAGLVIALMAQALVALVLSKL
jgi:hypothetical protein